MLHVDLVEWERFGYRQGLSRAEIEQMSLREYVLRRQALMRSHVETLRIQTLPIVNAWTEDPVTVEDFFGGARAMSSSNVACAPPDSRFSAL